MTVARTTLLDLPIITTGTESGLWGDYTNNGLTQYLDIAIAGITSLTSANFTAGALTIETTEGTNSATNIVATSAQYATIRVSSLAVNSTITVGNTGTNPGRSYRLINDDSTYTLTFKATGQTGITLQPGQSAVVAFNGTDYALVGTIGPTVPVARGGTGATTLTLNNVVLGNGTSAVQFVAPGTTGNVLTSNGTTWASTAPAAGGITYVTKTSNYTTQNNEGVLANTAGGAFTVTLPATPATGAQVIVADPTGNWGTNNLTIGRNGSTIAGVAQDLLCNINGVSVQLVYSGTTWTVYAQVGGNTGLVAVSSGGTGATTLTANNVILGNGTSAVQFVAPGSSGNVLTSNGTTWTSTAGAVSANFQEFTCSGTWTKPSGATFVMVELWGAGGGGGSGRKGSSATRKGGGGGGGGARGFRMFKASDLTSTVTVTIGAGGTGGTAITSNNTDGNTGNVGGTTTFGSYLAIYGGGGGGGGNDCTSNVVAGGGGGGTGSAGQSASPISAGGGKPQSCGFGSTSTNRNSVGGGGAGSGGISCGANAEYGGGSGGMTYTPSSANSYIGGSSINGGGGGGSGGSISYSGCVSSGASGGTSNSYTAGGGGAGGGAGTAGTAGSQQINSSGSGGGGGGHGNAAAAGAGGAGGVAGGGGGGGGGSTNPNNSGAGGTGGKGFARIYTW